MTAEHKYADPGDSLSTPTDLHLHYDPFKHLILTHACWLGPEIAHIQQTYSTHRCPSDHSRISITPLNRKSISVRLRKQTRGLLQRGLPLAPTLRPAPVGPGRFRGFFGLIRLIKGSSYGVVTGGAREITVGFSFPGIVTPVARCRPALPA